VFVSCVGLCEYVVIYEYEQEQEQPHLSSIRVTAQLTCLFISSIQEHRMYKLFRMACKYSVFI